MFRGECNEIAAKNFVAATFFESCQLYSLDDEEVSSNSFHDLLFSARKDCQGKTRVQKSTLNPIFGLDGDFLFRVNDVPGKMMLNPTLFVAVFDDDELAGIAANRLPPTAERKKTNIFVGV